MLNFIEQNKDIKFLNLSPQFSVYISETGFKTANGGDDVEIFEKLLNENRCAVERFVKFRIRSEADAEDILQEIYFSAYQKFEQLKNISSFKTWIIRIARNKCNDYFRRKAAHPEIPYDAFLVREMSDSRHGRTETVVYQPVSDILNLLTDKDKQILNLYYWGELSQQEIAKVLNLPLGTVKSRLYTARRNFKNKYPYHPNKRKGVNDMSMKKMPEFLPEYTIVKSDKAPFKVKWEELMGWFIVPRSGEKLSWGIYDIPSRKCSSIYHMQVTGKAMVHDIVGSYTVTINGRDFDCVCVMDIESPGCDVVSEQYLDANGKTVLWRRFNRNDWAIDRYRKKWSEQLPENEQLIVDGETYVHWYDCITDYIL